MKNDQMLKDFLEKNKFQWVNCIDKVGKKHGGRLMQWSDDGILLGGGIMCYEPSIELHGVGATISEIIAIKEIGSISTPEKS